jgi:hypothetical protein
VTTHHRPLALLLSSLALTSCGDLDAAYGSGGAAAAANAGGDEAAGARAEGGASPSPCGAPPEDPAFAVGTGDICFEPLSDDQVVPRVAGPQGGHHVWVAVACASCPYELVVRVGTQLDGAWLTAPSERVVELHSHQVAGLLATLTDPIDPTSTLPDEGTSIVLVVDLETLEREPLAHGEVSVVLGEIVPWQNKCDPDPLTCGKLGALKCCS